MSDETREIYRLMKERAGEEKLQRRQDRVAQLHDLRAAGFHIKQLTPYQFRINGRLDYYPTRNRYHDIETGKRGSARPDIIAFATAFFKKEKP